MPESHIPLHRRRIGLRNYFIKINQCFNAIILVITS